MKHHWETNYLPFLKTILNDLRTIEKNNEWDYIYSIIEYIADVVEIPNQKEFIEIIQTGLSEKSE
jgi:hypothetical protein